MASLVPEFSKSAAKGGKTRRKTGWFVQFSDKRTGGRPKVRLGPVSRKNAECVRRHIEHLLVARAMSVEIDLDTAHWLAGVEEVIYQRLLRVGLVQSRDRVRKDSQQITLEQLITQYLDVRRPNLKPNTIRNLEQAGKKLTGHFGGQKALVEISKGDAFDWRERLLMEHAEAGAATHIAKAKQFFAYALDHGYISIDPFAGLKKGSQKNRKRLQFVTAEEIGRLLEACPDNQWRLIVVLARYGGLRTPSEMQNLTWSDVDWVKNKIRIEVKKKEHIDGHEVRFIPIFPEIETYLKIARDEDKDAVYLVPRARRIGVNLGTQLCRFIKQAGLERWPRVFQNLRASRDTELIKKYPIHLVNYWMGHSTRVAQDHYQIVTDEDFLMVERRQN